jgi:chromosome segregation ATPase
MSAPASDSQATIALLAQKLDMFGGLLVELKGLMQQLDQRLQQVERNTASYQSANDARLDETNRRLDEHEREIEKQESEINGLKTRINQSELTVQRLMIAYGVLVFIGSAFGLSVIALIWSLLTGQAQLVFQ